METRGPSEDIKEHLLSFSALGECVLSHCRQTASQPADCDRVCLCNAVRLSSQEEVMVLERILLQTIKFDLQVDHPYQFLLRYAKQLKGIYVCLVRFSEAN